MTFSNKIWIFFEDERQCEVAVLWLKGKVVSFVHFVLYYGSYIKAQKAELLRLPICEPICTILP